MILGIGTDIAGIDRIRKGLDRHGSRFAERILSGEELPLLPSGTRAAAFLAGRWAAKEACAKALGTGFADGIGPSSIQVFNDPMGAPRLELLGAALERFRAMGGSALHASLSHERDHAVAVVVVEGERPAPAGPAEAAAAFRARRPRNRDTQEDSTS